MGHSLRKYGLLPLGRPQTYRPVRKGVKSVSDICPRLTHPLSPPLRNVDSSIMATQSRLPSTYFISVRPPLFPPSRSSSSKSAKPPPSSNSLAELRPPPRNT